PGPLPLDRRAGGGELPLARQGPILQAIARFERTALPPLLRLCEHADVEVRFYAVYLLSQLAYPESLAAMGARTCDEDAQVRAVGVDGVGGTSALAPARGRALWEELRAGAAATGSSWRAWLCAVALGELRAPGAVPTLIDLLDRRDPRITSSAHRAL